MKSYEAAVTIAATPQKVWDTLTDISAWPTWDSGVLEIEGGTKPGDKIKLVSEANPKRAFSLRVAESSPPSSMVWAGGMPLGLFKGVRTYKLRPDGATTHLVMREEYTGVMLPLIWKSMPDLQPSFDKFVTGLKERVESAA